MTIDFNIYSVSCHGDIGKFFVYSRIKKEYFTGEYYYDFSPTVFGQNYATQPFKLKGWFKTKEDCLVKINDFIVKDILKRDYIVNSKEVLFKSSKINSLIEQSIIKRKMQLLEKNLFKMTPSDKRLTKRFLLEKIKKGHITPIDLENYIHE